MMHSMFKFGLVGMFSTVIHIIVGYLLIQAGWHALAANFGAFLTAFFVSFVGHLGFSFADQKASISSSLWKFCVVGLLGFSCNQSLLATLLSKSDFSPSVALFISTACVAFLTFFLSRFWAFRGSIKVGHSDA